jgi:hypothetical protein
MSQLLLFHYHITPPKDQKSTEWKYLVRGDTFNGRGVCVVAKISTTGKLVIITVYALS